VSHPARRIDINLHHEGEIAALAAQFEPNDPDQSQITVLAAFPGAGRRYLLRRAIELARQQGRPVFAAELDLDGADVEKLNLHAYWEFQQAKRSSTPTPEAQRAFERLAGRTPTPGLTELSMAALLIGLDADSSGIVERAALAIGTDNPWESLAKSLSSDERLAIHFVDTSEIPAPLRAKMLDLAMERPALKLFVSSHRREGVGKVVRGRPNVRFEVMPLERGELESMVERRLGSPGIPPGVYDRLLEETGGGMGAAAQALERFAGSGAIVPALGGDWRWLGDGKELSPGILDKALEGVDEERRRLLASFAHLAALCGDNIPVKKVLAYLGVEGDDDLDDAIDQIDETLGADSDIALFAERFQHPGLPAELIYGFRDAATAYSLRESLTETTRQRLALELAQSLARDTPLSSRANVRMLAEVCRHAGADENRRELERELAWRVGPPDVEALEKVIVEEVRGGQLPVREVWKAVNSGQLRWPPYRTLAVLDAIGKVAEPQGLPPAFFAIRAGVLLDLDRNADAQDAAQAGLAMDMDDALLSSALWERLGTAQQRLGLTEDAAQSYQQSQKIQENLLEAGDARVAPLFEQAVRALEAGGRTQEAEELRKKIQHFARRD
jgi:tetratricopeptide (TPR) repeat protein